MPDLLPPAELAAALASELSRDLLFIAADEQRAAAVAAIAAAFAPDAAVIHLPSSDALPGDDSPPSPANAGRRVAALRRLRALQGAGERPRILLVTTAEATAQRLPAPAAFDAAPPLLRVGDAIDPAAFAAEAEALGYVADDRIDEPGEIGVRGGGIDIFPADLPHPVRIDLADGRIAAIRAYDPVTQRGGEELAEFEIGRAIEPPLGEGVALPDHLPGAALALDDGVGERRDRFLAIAADGALRSRTAASLVDDDAWQRAIAGRERIDPDPGTAPPPRFVEQRNPVRGLKKWADGALAEGRVLLAGSARDLRFLAPRLARAGLPVATPVTSWAEAVAAPAGATLSLAAPVERGFVASGVAVIAGADLLGGRAGGEDAGSGGNPLLGLSELRVGDVIVHEDFGIGTVEGIAPLPEEGGDAIALGYAKGARRLVPVAEADRIWRYGADADAVTLDALDGHTWLKRRGDIDAAIAESARGLAALAAERDARVTDPIVPDAAAYEKFAAGFPFTETADQARAIAAVRADLASGKPMDRLVVGDVGYGKTEVALRAAAMVALAGRQVALAAPTTVLVRQHIETFRRRFKAAGIEVAGLSRLSTPAEKKRVKAGLADGSIKVVIGTVAVAGKDIAYADLALVIVDEEQRFGTADKAKLHGLGAGHVLTLSATPIPRTLQSALVGLQQVSVIATPPARRQPIRTAVHTWDDAVVRAALLREKSRGGQSFVVVPRIEDMAPLAAKLAKFVPEAKVIEAHGKLPALDLDAAMVGFAAGEGDVLLATNIIEAGLDVPRANTMIVHHADRFGLSQLHQLRGRVGRGGRRGQILLLTDPEVTIAEATLKRLRALQAFDRLGAGFAISARDLDLRGAGDLLGDTQSGHMKLIGVDLYQHLLGLALRHARGEAVDEWLPELNLGLAGSLPPDWIPEVETRLSFYGRLARLREVNEVDALEEELEDRMGALPAAAQTLLRHARTRAFARAAGIVRIDAGPAAVAFSPRGRAGEPPAGLTEKNGRWLLAERIEDASERLDRIDTVLGELAG